MDLLSLYLPAPDSRADGAHRVRADAHDVFYLSVVVACMLQHGKQHDASSEPGLPPLLAQLVHMQLLVVVGLQLGYAPAY